MYQEMEFHKNKKVRFLKFPLIGKKETFSKSEPFLLQKATTS